MTVARYPACPSNKGSVGFFFMLLYLLSHKIKQTPQKCPFKEIIIEKPIKAFFHWLLGYKTGCYGNKLNDSITEINFLI